ncbi:EAL domain-containing protein [Pseudoduganella violacea]|uniref:PAS domain S-box-containing protein n=1 Tax=Pseudoduganella violacea TaxID=1715466 RepID=A0A7W5FXC9_9BURK|nr:EAL domain-containing protein [Pseudoduganella violacea]MBB3122123.1 PAS domain S-box-containing protein [Pseudoduganella violacea]
MSHPPTAVLFDREDHLPRKAGTADELSRLAAFICGKPIAFAVLADEEALHAAMPDGLEPAQRQALFDLARVAAGHNVLRRRLARAEGFLQGFAEHSPSPLWIKDRRGSYVMGNAALHGLLGVEQPGLLGKDDSHFWPEDISRSLAEQDRAVLDHGEVIKTMETSEDGARHWLVHKFPIDVDGEPFLGGSAIEMTNEVEKERTLIRHDNFYVLLSRLTAIISRARHLETLCLDACRVASTQQGIDLVDIACADPISGALSMFTSAASDGSEQVWPAHCNQAGPPADWFAVDAATQAVTNGKMQISHEMNQACRRRNIASCMAIPLFVNERCWGVISIYSQRADFFDSFYRERAGELGTELSFGLERLINAQELHKLARTNALSGLPSRLQFEEQIAALAASNMSGTVLLVNINRFDDLSSAYGNAAAIGLMRVIAQRLRAAVNERMLLSHVGIGRFALFLPATLEDSPENFVHETIVPLLQGAYQVEQHKIWCTINVGAASLPADGVNADTLLVKAWDALASARDRELRFGVYNREELGQTTRQISLESELRDAIERKEFINYYQPKIDLKTGRLAGAEALIRWRHPQRGLVPPAEFVPLLERSGLVIAAGRQVMQRAMEDWRGWHDAGLKPPQIAVNVAPAQFRCDSLLADIQHALETAGARHHPLSIEITESSLVSDHRRVAEILHRIRRLDVPIAIDDFGTGYSSLAYLVSLPVDVLKVDRSFVMKMTQDAGYMGLVNTIVSLAHTLDLKVVAEGIESEEEAKLLKLLRCEQGQGYLYGRPVPAEEFAAMLKR